MPKAYIVKNTHFLKEKKRHINLHTPGGGRADEMEGAEEENEEDSGGSGARTQLEGKMVGSLEPPWRRVLARVFEMEAAMLLLVMMML